MNKKKRRLRAILIALLVPVLGFIGTVIVLGMQRAMRYEAPEIEQAGQAVHAVPTPTPKPKPSPGSTAARPALSETLNLLLIGVDDVNGVDEESRGNADGVIIARPYVTAVYGGAQEGIAALTEKLGKELADTMKMCGTPSLSAITKDCIVM